MGQSNLWRGLAFIAFGALCACAAQPKEARFYPTNDLGARDGMLRATYMDAGMGRGRIEMTLPSGEQLTGEYTTQDTTTYGFGSILSLVGGVSASSVGSSVQMTGSQPGTANLIGDRGTRLDCEYLVNALTGSGSGACRSSTGAIYRLHFG